MTDFQFFAIVVLEVVKIAKTANSIKQLADVPLGIGFGIPPPGCYLERGQKFLSLHLGTLVPFGCHK